MSRALVLVVLIACDQGEPVVDARTAAASGIEAFGGFRVEMCWCVSKACTEMVGQRMREAHERWRAAQPIEPTPTADYIERMQSIGNELVNCHMRALMSGL